MIAITLFIALVTGASPSATQGAGAPAEELVQALRELPELSGIGPSDGVMPPEEQRRLEIYDQFWALGDRAMPALCRGPSDPDVRVRRNVALFLGLSGSRWYRRERQRLVIDLCVPSLIEALVDTDSRVRRLAAQAVGAAGSAGAPAVPALIRLLGSSSEGDRDAACMGLADIGGPAKDALPALKRAASDGSANVRSLAKRAIELIER